MPNTTLDQIRKLIRMSESTGITIARVPVRQLIELLALAERDVVGTINPTRREIAQAICCSGETCRKPHACVCDVWMIEADRILALFRRKEEELSTEDQP